MAILIHLIVNRNVLFVKKHSYELPAQKEYRGFLIGALMLFIMDSLWGAMNELELASAQFVVTTILFAVMMVSIFLWIRYVIAYLEKKDKTARVLYDTGIALLALQIVALAANFFIPILFYYDENGVYHSGSARYLTFILQIVMFLLTSIFSFVISARSQGKEKLRHRTIAWFGIAMILLIGSQMFLPMLPLYTIGYLLGSCLLHSFVVEDEEQDYCEQLEKMLDTVHQREQELDRTKEKMYTDALTGVKSKQAYIEKEKELDRSIREGAAEPFAVIVFDLNNLKQVNDTLGHDTGDTYIYRAALLISEFFYDSSVYRVGGDEFAVIIEGQSYKDRQAVLESFEWLMDNSSRSDKIVVSSGMADYIPGEDRKLSEVFERADKNMYSRKKLLKATD